MLSVHIVLDRQIYYYVHRSLSKFQSLEQSVIKATYHHLQNLINHIFIKFTFSVDLWSACHMNCQSCKIMVVKLRMSYTHFSKSESITEKVYIHIYVHMHC